MNTYVETKIEKDERKMTFWILKSILRDESGCWVNNAKVLHSVMMVRIVFCIRISTHRLRLQILEMKISLVKGSKYDWKLKAEFVLHNQKCALERVYQGWKELEAEKENCNLSAVMALLTKNMFSWHCYLWPDNGSFRGTIIHLIIWPAVQDHPNENNPKEASSPLDLLS